MSRAVFGFRFLLGRRWERAATWVGCLLASGFMISAHRSSSFEELASSARYFLLPLAALAALLMIDLVLEVLLYLDEDPDDLWDGEGR